jgi:hypothetical protein
MAFVAGVADGVAAVRADHLGFDEQGVFKLGLRSVWA